MLDLRRLAERPALTSLLERGPGSNWFFYSPEPPVRFADQVGQAVRELAIQREDIEDAMGHEMAFIEGKVLILNTGWAARFLTTHEDLADRQNELCHAWLVHPWLSQKTAEAIADSGAIGVAIDAPMVDCPLYVSHGDLAQKVQDSVFSIEYDRDESGTGIMMEPNDQPMHSRGLPRGMLLFEHLMIRQADADRLYDDRSVCMPEMLAFYYRLDGVLDGALCKLLLRDTREVD
jgi:kynurenine formamidase